MILKILNIRTTQQTSRSFILMALSLKLAPQLVKRYPILNMVNKGETRVLVRGGPFAQYKNQYPRPKV